MANRKATGRPPLDPEAPSLRVGFTVSEALWQRVMEEAERRQVSMSEICREALLKLLPKQSEGEG